LEDALGASNVSTDPLDRVVYARDALPRELLAIRNGILSYQPEVVVWPVSTEQVAEVLAIARKTHTPVTPVSASSGVCGGAIPLKGGIVMDLKRMNQWHAIDTTSHRVTVGPGVIGQDYEETLNRHGLTGGHFPSSMYCSSVGGWINTRAAGQLSTQYGKIEDMVAGLEAVLADGTVIHTLDTPRQAAGPDFNQILTGSEGTLGIITRATLRVFPYPEHRLFESWLFPDVAAGLEGIRQLMVRGARPAVCRLYDEMDTMLTMGALGHPVEGVLVMLVYEGDAELKAAEAAVGRKSLAASGGKPIGEEAARHWWGHRYKISYQQSNILEHAGQILDTIEVAGPWSRLMNLYTTMKEALATHAVVLAHFSHHYLDGANIYFSLVGQGTEGKEPEAYDAMWKAAMDACVAAGGAISHHHGVGSLKAPWMERSHGAGAMHLYRALKKALDPAGILNPGKMGL
jgi:alkyldihydroxyacetonephosphate synthase